MPPVPASQKTNSPLDQGTLSLSKLNVGNPKIQLPPGGGFAAVQPASTQQGMTLRQAMLYAKSNPTSDFASTLGGFIVKGDADERAMHEGVDLSFAGRPSLQQMYSDHLAKSNVEMPGDSSLESLRKGFMDLLDKAGDDTVQQQQQEGGEKMLQSVEEGSQKEETANDANDLPGEIKANAETALGTAAGGVQSIFAPVTGIMQALSDKASDSNAMQDFASGNKVTGGILDLQDQLESKINEIAQAHPEAAKNIGDAANVLLATLGGESEAGAGALKTDIGDAANTTKQSVIDAAGPDGPGGAAAQMVSDAAGRVKEGAQAAGNKVLDAAQAIGDKAAGGKKAAGEGAKSLFNKIYGLPADTTDFLIKHPEFATPEALKNANIYNIGQDVQAAHAKASQGFSSAADLEKEVQEGLQTKIQALNQHAKEYSTLGNDSKPGAPRKLVKVDPDWLRNQLKKVAGVDIDKDGRVTHGDANSKINTADSPNGAQIMQNLWDTYGPEFAKGKMSQATFLKFRQSLATLANYKGGIDTVANEVSHSIRDNFNKEYRKQIPGLDEIDATHTKMQRDLEDSLTGLGTIDESRGLPRIKMNEGSASNIINAGKDTRGHLAARLENVAPGILKKIESANNFEGQWKSIFDDQGQLKEGALHNIKNAVNAGRDLRLEKLEKLLPGITDKLKLAKAAEDFHAAFGPKPGLYAGTALGLSGASTGATIGATIGGPVGAVIGGPLGMLTGMYAASPEVGLRVLRAFAKHAATR